MTDFQIDLDAYCARIGFAGPRAPTLDALTRIVLLHQRAIAFENLDSFSGLNVIIDPARIETKIIAEGRGGYCHEQNQYLRLALIAFGFDARFRMARVRWMVPPDVMPQRGHMMLNVAVDGRRYLCDVAFGAMTPTAPLLLVPDIEQATPHQTYRFIQRGEELQLDVKLWENWRPVYSFDQVDYRAVDFEAANWLVSTHPKSEFVRNLVVARPTEDCRQILNNASLAIRHRDGSVEKRELADTSELRSTLTTMFGIKLPINTNVDAALERIFQNSGRS